MLLGPLKGAGAPTHGARLDGLLLAETGSATRLRHLVIPAVRWHRRRHTNLGDAIGTYRLLFGTNLPFIVPQSPIMELGDARLSESEDADVR